jgi:hypothetical protein
MRGEEFVRGRRPDRRSYKEASYKVMLERDKHDRAGILDENNESSGLFPDFDCCRQSEKVQSSQEKPRRMGVTRKKRGLDSMFNRKDDAGFIYKHNLLINPKSDARFDT